MPDHVHLFVKTPPTIAVHFLVQQLKGITARELRKQFKHLKTSLPSMWTRSYYVESVGHISEETIRRYIEEQKNKWFHTSTNSTRRKTQNIWTICCPKHVSCGIMHLLYKKILPHVRKIHSLRKNAKAFCKTHQTHVLAFTVSTRGVAETWQVIWTFLQAHIEKTSEVQKAQGLLFVLL